jgi:Uma2 family endonuclease
MLQGSNTIPTGDETMATAIRERIPELVQGDKLTRQEFLRRWEAHPEIKKAELIGGIVYMASPVSVQHGEMDGCVGGWLCVYQVATAGTACGHNTTSLLLEDSPQPDVYLRVLPEYGGATWVNDRFLEGVPELLVEVCRSSVSYDLHVKFDLYETAKVPEYLAILLDEQEIRWHALVNDRYELLPPDADGFWRSRVFPGLWLDGKALLAGDMKQVLAQLGKGLSSPEHQRFVADLAARKKG